MKRPTPTLLIHLPAEPAVSGVNGAEGAGATRIALPWFDASVVYVDREHERIAMARAGLLD